MELPRNYYTLNDDPIKNIHIEIVLPKIFLYNITLYSQNNKRFLYEKTDIL